jgi:hypothetical protein
MARFFKCWVSETVYDSFDAGFDEFLIKVDQEAKFYVGES